MGQASLQLVFCSQEGQPVFKLLREGKAGSGPLAGQWLCCLDTSWQPASCVLAEYLSRLWGHNDLCSC